MRIGQILAVVASAALLTSPVMAGPADVNAQEFYLQAKQVMGKGLTAMFDKRTKPLVAQMKDAGESARAANEAATKAGKPLYCASDAERKKGLNPKQVLAMLERLPESQRRNSTLRQAWRAALAREYPCG